MNPLKAEDLAVINTAFEDPKERDAYLHGYTDLFYTLSRLSKEHPNDAEFGAAVRTLFTHEKK